MEKYFLFFILICNSYLIFAKFFQDFSDGYFSKNPIRKDNITRFEVDLQN